MTASANGTPPVVPATGQGGADELADLCEQAVSFSRSLAGPLKRIAVRRGDAAVEVDWHEPSAVVDRSAHGGAGGAGTAGADGLDHSAVPAGVTVLSQVVEADDVHIVHAPLVGTFYQAPAPGEEPFITVGSPVSVGQTLGIVEAMKLMNTIVSDVEGHVVELLVADGQSVEFEQPLVKVALVPAALGSVDVARAG